MVIGLLVLEIHLPHSTSLKDKRSAIAAFKERIKKRFNVSLAEVAHQDKWQRASLAFITINSEQKIVDQTLAKILTEAEMLLDAEITRSEIRYF
ncbi:MAG: DUF503 domain-containing protein [Candidatus Aminicenantales bacterium]